LAALETVSYVTLITSLSVVGETVELITCEAGYRSAGGAVRSEGPAISLGVDTLSHQDKDDYLQNVYPLIFHQHDISLLL